MSFLDYTEQVLVFPMTWGRVCFPNRCTLFQARVIRGCAPLVLIVCCYFFYVALIWLFWLMWSWRFFIALIAWCCVFSCLPICFAWFISACLEASSFWWEFHSLYFHSGQDLCILSLSWSLGSSSARYRSVRSSSDFKGFATHIFKDKQNPM